MDEKDPHTRPNVAQQTTYKKRSYLAATLGNRCPRCREGRLFVNTVKLKLDANLKMHTHCPLCGQPTEIEVGFYYGTGYVSYALTVAISVTTLVAWLVLIGMSFEDNRFLVWLIANSVLLVLLQPWMMRLSRSLWISWFVSYDPDWQQNPIKEEDIERIIPDQMQDNS